MATITFFAPTKIATAGSLATSNGAASQLQKILDGSAMGFGYLTSAWPSHILKDATARYSNLVDTPTEGDNMSRTLHHISVGNTDDSPDAYSVFYRTINMLGLPGIEEAVTINAGGWDVGRPYEQEVNRMVFNSDTQVQVDEIDVWISSAAAGTAVFTYASVFVLEASATGTTDWATATPHNKKSFDVKSSAAVTHVWGYGLSAVPHTEAVGFVDAYLQVSVTYS